MAKDRFQRRSAWDDHPGEKPVETAAPVQPERSDLADTWGDLTNRALPEHWQDPAGEPDQTDQPASIDPMHPTIALIHGIAAPAALRNRPVRERKRAWERQHNQEVASYRGIPDEVHETMLWIALDRRIAVGLVACAFLEFGEQAYLQGDLQFNPKPQGPKMTLYAKANNPLWKIQPGQPAERKTGRTKQHHPGSAGQNTRKRTYRGIPHELQARIVTYAHGTIRIGDVVRLFLEYAIRKYAQGVLDFADGESPAV